MTALFLIARDEAENLSACVEPVLNLFREKVLVDTGSKDNTVELAQTLGFTVYSYPWTGSFSAARNFALTKITESWVFWLDADDRLSTSNCLKLTDLLNSLPSIPTAFLFKLSCQFFDHITPILVPHPRLFLSSPRLSWQYRVHEQIFPQFMRLGYKISVTDIIIDHMGYLDEAVHRVKLHRNLELLKMDRKDFPCDPVVLYNLSSTYYDLGNLSAARTNLSRSLVYTSHTTSLFRDIIVLMVRIFLSEGDSKSALYLIQANLTLLPDDSYLLFLQAQIYHEEADFALAERCYRRILSHTRFSDLDLDAGLRGSTTRYALAQVLLAQNRVEEAKLELQMCLRCEPTSDLAAQLLSSL